MIDLSEWKKEVKKTKAYNVGFFSEFLSIFSDTTKVKREKPQKKGNGKKWRKKRVKKAKTWRKKKG